MSIAVVVQCKQISSDQPRPQAHGENARVGILVEDACRVGAKLSCDKESVATLMQK